MSEHTEVKKQMVIDAEKKVLPPALSLFSLEGKTCICLASDSSSFMTGGVIYLDGGGNAK